MMVLDKTEIGCLRGPDGAPVVRVMTGAPVSIGGLKGFALLHRGEGPQILFLMPRCGHRQKVTARGRRQAGAFLLEPGQNVTICENGAQTTFCFNAAPVIPVSTEAAEVCEFCRTPFTQTGRCGKFCPSSRLADAGGGILLCDGCAYAWALSQQA